MSDDPCPLCSADAPTRRALLAVQGEALDWSTRLSSIEYSERWARDAAVDADDVGLDDIAAKLRGCESGLALGGDAIRALIRIRAWLAEVEAERDAARAEIEELRLTLAAERGDPAGAPSSGWEYGVIDEEGGRGWRKKTADGMLFAWGAGIDFLGADHTPAPHPGGWTRWLADEDGDLDEMPECVTDETWTARAAMIAADKAQGGA